MSLNHWQYRSESELLLTLAQTSRTRPLASGVGERDWRALIAVGSVATATLVLITLIFVARSGIPIWDDGALVLSDRLPATLTSVLLPYHQHLDAVPILIWSALTSPAQMLGLLLLTHLALAVGTTTFLVRQLGAAVGFALGLPLALLGTAHYDLLMPWQILFTIPLLCGLVATWASLARNRTAARRTIVAVAMLIAVACSSVGLFLGLALGLWFALDRRQRQTWELVPSALVWVVWFVTFGLTGLGTDGSPRDAAIVPYTIAGLATGVGGVLGLGTMAGLGVLVALGGWAIATRPRIRPAFAGFALAVVAMFVVASLFRSYGTVEQATEGRYIYLVAYLLAFGLGASAIRVAARPVVVVIGGIAAAGLNLVALVGSLYRYP